VDRRLFPFCPEPVTNREVRASRRDAGEVPGHPVENSPARGQTQGGRGESGRATRPIGKSRRFLEALRLAEQVAPTDSRVLITGESGTGKEVVERYIHDRSARAGKPFLSINCGALPENLLESELFGHVKGSFTGAVR